MTAPATAGDVFAALYAAHQAGDYWVQAGSQARDKGLPGWPGRLACGKHVATMTACKAGTLILLHAAGHRVSPRRAALALAADAASHYWADRRFTLARLAGLARHGDFWHLGAPRPGRDDNPCMGTGGHAMDQAFHIVMLWAASVITAGGSR